MADPGTALSIVSLLKKAYDLYKSCKAAPEEIQTACEHIHCLQLVLEGVNSDLLNNKRSFLHQTTDIAKARQQNLKVHLAHCDGSMKKVQAVLKKYHSFKHVSLWDKFRWSTDGKKEIAEMKVDLMMATSQLDLFMSKEGLSVLWKLEAMMDIFMKKFEMLELFQDNDKSTRQRGRPRSSSNVGRTLVASLVITRLRGILHQYRRKKNARKSKPKDKNPRRPKPVTRISSGFAPNKNRAKLLQSYAQNIAKDARPKKPDRTRAPSPTDSMFNNKGSIASISPTRRSSSMNRLLTRINANTPKNRAPTERYECWKVGTGSMACGFKVPSQFIPHKRGQLQLRKMAAAFQEAEKFDGQGEGRRSLNDRDGRVREILKLKNEKEKKTKSGKKWSLVAARVLVRDPGRTGMVIVEKALVVLVRS